MLDTHAQDNDKPICNERLRKQMMPWYQSSPALKKKIGYTHM